MSVWSLWLVVTILSGQTSTQVVHHFDGFSSVTDAALRRAVIDDKTGDVYVGGVNVIYRLSPKLKLLADVETGKRADNVNCRPDPTVACSGNHTRSNVDSINQALVIVSRQLLACSTLYYGYCEKYSLTNLTLIETIYASVVPNDKRSSVVFIVGAAVPTRLYVGTTHSDVGLARFNTAPMVSSRSLTTLKYASESETAASYIDLRPQYLRADFKVHFRGGFRHDSFVYFVVVRPRLVDGLPTYSSWLIRLCDGDDRFHSYVEVPLECTQSNRSYAVAIGAHIARPRQKFPGFRGSGDALFVAFSTAEGNTAKTTTDVAVCSYSMERVKLMFVQNIGECFHGEGKIGPYHLVPPEDCTKANYIDYCGEHGVNYPIEGQHPVKPDSLHPVTGGHRVTGLAVKPVGQFIVALLGTDQGQIVKMEVRPFSDQRSTTEVYEVVDVQLGAAINSDLLLDSTDTHVYAMTASKVHQVLLSNCSRFMSCDACHAAGDPHCGWCLLHNRCTLPTECPGSSSAHNWVSFQGTGCPAIESLTPRMVDQSIFNRTKFIVTLRNVPLVVDQTGLRCELQSLEQKLTSNTEDISPNNLTCRPFLSIPTVSRHTGFEELQFNVMVNNSRVASTTVIVYQCSYMESCRRCSGSRFGCMWCPLDGSCVNNTSHCTNGKEISNAASCPWVRSLAPVGDHPRAVTNELLIPAGVSSSVIVIVINLQESYTKNLKCRFGLGGGLIVAANVSHPVTPESTTVTCQPIQFDFEDNKPFLTVTVDVLWGDDKPVDSPNSAHVKVYKCEAMEVTCGQCLTLDRHYQCGWCNDHCSLKGRCPVTWLDPSRICPDPQITSFSPVAGPVQGGTVITVNGTNLGTVVGHLVGGVTVAGVPCEVRPQHFMPSLSFTCQTSAATCVTSHDGCVTFGSGEVKFGNVKVVVNGTYSAESSSEFLYVVPSLTDIHPKKGPQSGGTRVTIKGQYLDTGNTATVFVQDTNVSSLRSRNRTSLVFVMPRQVQPIMASVHLVIDNQTCRLDNSKFEYVTDPTITSVTPRQAIYQGGIRLLIVGTGFDSVAEPKLVLELPGNEIHVPCVVTTTTAMHCMVPHLGIESPTHVRYINFGFIMDNVTALRNISKNQPDIGRMKLLPNPVAFPFTEEGGVREYNPEELVILGDNLNIIGHFPEAFHIFVGNSPCNVTAFQIDRVLCVPPTQPLQLNEDRKAEVVVTLGNFRAEIGSLRYTDVATALPTLLILGIALGVSLPLLLIFLFLLFICLRRHYSQTHKKPMVKLVPDAAGSLRPMYKNRHSGAAAGDGVGGRNGQPLELVPLKSDEDGARRRLGPPDTDHDGGNASAIKLSAVLDGIQDAILKRTIQEVLVPRERLEIGDVIGKGHFGCVYVTRMRDAELGFSVKVAVKTLQGNNYNQESIESFLAEGVIMKDFDHPHILRLLGMSIDERGNPMVILPYMANGDLRSYVKDKTRSFTARQLLRLAQQVAEGMAYLASLNFIHRDLAARNCMIDDVMTVKVADFGLARALYQKEYYSSREHKGKMPIKWMALESLEDLIFTTKSDVWSFGVLLWELMTRCMTPYPDVDVFDIRNYLASGQRLKQPKYCPDSIYKIMCECWHAKPEQRPTFIDLVNQLELLLNPPSKRRFPLDNSEPMYMNIRLESSDYLEPISMEGGDNSAGGKFGHEMGNVGFV